MTDFAAKYDWWIDGARLRVGLLKRPQPQVPHMTLPKYRVELAELAGFTRWLIWRTHGKVGADPGWKPGAKKKWAWQVLGEYQHVHPVPPPKAPGPAERLSIWKKPPWRGIGLHVTWAFHSDEYTPQSLADRIAGTRVEWVFFELNPDVINEQYTVPFFDALKRHGRRRGIWERADAQKEFPEERIDHVKRIVNTYEPDFYGADIEEFPVDTPELPGQVAEAFPGLPRITLVPGEPAADQLEPWFAAGWDMMTQSYAANIRQPVVPGIAGPTDHDAYWRGCPRNFIPAPRGWGAKNPDGTQVNWWQHGSGPHTVPIIEVNAEGNPGLAAQLESDALTWFGGNWSIWNAELLTDDDWQLLK